jgi:CDP-diglyceride synthetase
MSTRQGFIGGTVVALFGSVIIASRAEHFWPTLLAALAFTMLCVTVVTWLVAVASRKPSSRT